VTHHMQLYDVGMTGLYLSDTAALIDLANARGRGDVVPTLQARFAAVSDALNTHLWDAEAGMYTNALFNGSFYRRWSPTSLFPMMSGVPSTQQATSLTAFATSPLGLCINATHQGPANSAMLIQYFDRHDNAECATDDCIRDQVLSSYNFVRVEALVSNTSVGAGPALYSWYNAQWGDNALTTDTTPPAAGYTLLRTEGYCKASCQPGDANLTLWYSAQRHDYKVCATPECLADTGYVLVKPLCCGWNGTGVLNLPCKYGAPSIARGDPAFFDNGYWRGR